MTADELRGHARECYRIDQEIERLQEARESHEEALCAAAAPILKAKGGHYPRSGCCAYVEESGLTTRGDGSPEQSWGDRFNEQGVYVGVRDTYPGGDGVTGGAAFTFEVLADPDAEIARITESRGKVERHQAAEELRRAQQRARAAGVKVDG